MRRRLVRSSALVLALGLTLTACGSDDEDRAVSALKSQIVGNNAMQGSTSVTDQQASCIARGAVDELTVERLQDYEILDDDLEVARKLSEVPLKGPDADQLAGVYLECSDAEKIFEERLTEQLAADRPAARKRVAACVADTVTEDAVRDIIAQSLAKTDAKAYAALSKELDACRA